MKFSLSTSYFAGRHYAPEEMAARAVALGFAAVELGYFTRDVELDAWEDALTAEGLTVSSVHAFCPMPLSMPQLGPEVFSLASPDADERQAAIQAMLRTLAGFFHFNIFLILLLTLTSPKQRGPGEGKRLFCAKDKSAVL